MAIPAPSDQPNHRHRVILRVSVATALATSLVAALLWAGVLPQAARSSEHAGPQRAAAACPQCEACQPTRDRAAASMRVSTAVAPQLALGATAQPPGQAPPSPAAHPSTSEPLRRFSICEAPRGEPRVTLLPITPGGPPAIGVHCGTSVHVIAFDRGEPRRIARFDIGSAGSPPAAKSGEERAFIDRPGDLLATDVNGDGAIDIVVGTSREDEHGSPRTGVLLVSLRTRSGSFELPRLLAPLAVGSLSAAELDDAAGSDIAILRLEDSRLPRPNELVLLRGGPAPSKLFALPAGVAVDQLGMADLDVDGRTDLILGARARGAEIVFMGTGGHPKQRTTLAGLDVSAISIADLNNDGHDDALLTGSGANLILANATNAGALRSLPALQGLASVHILDWNADGKLDVLGIRTHALVALVQKGDLEFDSQVITQWPDADFQLRAVMAGRAYGGPLGLVLIASPVRARGRAELLLTSEMPSDANTVRTESLLDAPLRQQLSLP
jgi:hypothetical protein